MDDSIDTFFRIKVYKEKACRSSLPGIWPSIFFSLFGSSWKLYNTVPFNFGEQLFLQQHLICHELLHVSRRYPYRLLVFIFVPHHSSIRIFSSSSRLYLYIDRLSISRGLCNCPVKHIKAARSSTYSPIVKHSFSAPRMYGCDVLISHQKDWTAIHI